jgi:hypothetical protein
VLWIPGDPQHALVAEGLEVLRERRHSSAECGMEWAGESSIIAGVLGFILPC